MSSYSQTPPPPFRLPLRLGLGLAFTAGVLAIVVSPLRDRVIAAAARGRLHTPDLDLFMRLPVAIKVHLGAALLALALGAVLMTVRKGQAFHRVAGWMWVSLVAVTAGSTLFITSLTPGRYSWLHLFTAWVFIGLPLAVIWAKRREVARHRRNMMGLFYGGFAINLLVSLLPGRTLWAIFFG